MEQVFSCHVAPFVKLELPMNVM